MTVPRSRVLAVEERFERWSDVVNGFIPTILSSPRTEDFRASVRSLALGPVQGAVLSSSPVQSRRTEATIRRLDPQSWLLMLVIRGQLGIDQHGGRAVLAAGDLMVVDASHPYHLWTQAAGQACGVMVGLPRNMVPVPDGTMRSLAARQLPSQQGMGGIMRGLLDQVARTDGARPVDEANRVGSAVADLAAVYLAELARKQDRVSPPTRQVALVQRIKAFIEGNLSDTRLSPAAVAAAHNISRRYLYLLLEAEGETVQALIQARRLERCRNDLRQADRSVAAVGARWGFRDPAAFNRAFKKTYGLPPGEYRRQSTTQPG